MRSFVSFESNPPVRGAGILDAVSLILSLASLIVATIYSKQIWEAPHKENESYIQHHYYRWPLT
jgi:hypothetical protein